MKKCFSCYYFFWKYLEWYCFHPENNKPIKRPVGCKLWQDAYKKQLPDSDGKYSHDGPERLPFKP